MTMKAPIFNSTKYKLLKYLATGASINGVQAKAVKINSLSPVIGELKKEYGLVFKSEWTNAPARNGKPIRAKKYCLEGTNLYKAKMLILATCVNTGHNL